MTREDESRGICTWSATEIEPRHLTGTAVLLGKGSGLFHADTAVAAYVHRDECELNYHQALLDSMMCPLSCTVCVISLAK